MPAHWLPRPPAPPPGGQAPAVYPVQAPRTPANHSTQAARSPPRPQWGRFPARHGGSLDWPGIKSSDAGPLASASPRAPPGGQAPAGYPVQAPRTPANHSTQAARSPPRPQWGRFPARRGGSPDRPGIMSSDAGPLASAPPRAPTRRAGSGRLPSPGSSDPRDSLPPSRAVSASSAMGAVSRAVDRVSHCAAAASPRSGYGCRVPGRPHGPGRPKPGMPRMPSAPVSPPPGLPPSMLKFPTSWAGHSPCP
jgi:flagellar biosynthesis protein FlhF